MRKARLEAPRAEPRPPGTTMTGWGLTRVGGAKAGLAGRLERPAASCAFACASSSRKRAPMLFSASRNAFAVLTSDCSC